jgi:hypothetical protein
MTYEQPAYDEPAGEETAVAEIEATPDSEAFDGWA